MKIYIKTLGGLKITIDNATPNNTIEEIKEKIQEQYEQFPKSIQYLVLNGKRLENDKTLNELNIQNETIVHLVLSVKEY